MTDTRPLAQPKSDDTRGRLLALLREGAWTVDHLATRLGVTDNAVRFHLASLERAGSVRKEGLLRKPQAGKPADLYTLTADADEAFSRAYAPVLAACIAELRDTMSGLQVIAFLKRVGKRLATSIVPASGSLSSRVLDASKLLNDLGGVTSVEKSGKSYHIVGRACPLSRAVDTDPCVCSAVSELLAEVVGGVDVRECCDHSGRPKCHFEISSATAVGARATGRR
jgi:predicted ArsR family transcriptional regulator